MMISEQQFKVSLNQIIVFVIWKHIFRYATK